MPLLSQLLKSMAQTSLNGPVCDSPMGDGGQVTSASPPTPRPLKGRKRFSADLSELIAHPELISCSGGWSVRSAFPLSYMDASPI